MMLKALAFALTLTLGVFTAADARADNGREQAIRSVIEQQLQAFQQDDGQAAFAHASPMIQNMFKNPANFMHMVKTGYQPVYRPREVSFQDLTMVNGELVQRVLLVGPNNEVVVAHYMMQQQPDGVWKINGCILKSADESVV